MVAQASACGFFRNVNSNNQRNYHAIRVSACPDIAGSVCTGWRGNLQRTLRLLPRCACRACPIATNHKSHEPRGGLHDAHERSHEKQGRGYADSPDLRPHRLHRPDRHNSRRCSVNRAHVQEQCRLRGRCQITPMEWLERQPQQLTFSRRRIGRPHVLHRSKTEIEMGVQPR